MSKKLLMNKFSVNGLLPIQEGLVCWLDAFDLTSYTVNSVWLDRTGNNNNGTVNKLNDFQSIGNGILEAKSLVNIPNPIKGLSTFSIEIGYQDNGTGYWSGLCGFYSGSTSTGHKGLSLIHINKSYDLYPFNILPPSKEDINGGKNYVILVINSNDVTIYHNTTKFTSVNTITKCNKEILPSEANNLCFMARKPNTANENTTDGAEFRLNKWYYIRIYNKALTEEEVLNNYNYEMTLGRG